MKKLRYLPLLALVLCNCVGTQKFNNFVEHKYVDQQTAKSTADYLNITYDSLKKLPSAALSTKVTSRFIPAIFYWQWENTIHCDLDASIPADMFQSAFISFADSVNLKERLNGRKIELFIDEIPSRFMYSAKGQVIYLFFAYLTQVTEAISPVEQYLKVRYRITRAGDEPRTGIIRLVNDSKPVINVWKSTRKFTWAYLDDYEEHMRWMAWQCFDQFLDEL